MTTPSGVSITTITSLVQYFLVPLNFKNHFKWMPLFWLAEKCAFKACPFCPSCRTVGSKSEACATHVERLEEKYDDEGLLFFWFSFSFVFVYFMCSSILLTAALFLSLKLFFDDAPLLDRRGDGISCAAVTSGLFPSRYDFNCGLFLFCF
jgi:thiol-disulfide isomerase/thioredoxin